MGNAFDIGGAAGLGPIDTAPGEAPFQHEWEARVFALNRLFLKRGTYTLDEFRSAIEAMTPQAYASASYYERWLHAIETLLAQKGALP